MNSNQRRKAKAVDSEFAVVRATIPSVLAETQGQAGEWGTHSGPREGSGVG